MTVKEYSRLKEPYKKEGYLKYRPYASVQRALDNEDIRAYRSEDNELIGYVWVNNLKRKCVSRIEEIVCTKRGFGHIILKEAIAMCKHERIELHVVADNERAIECYKRNGFVEESREEGKVPIITMVYAPEGEWGR